jgi:hypothetical protein
MHYALFDGGGINNAKLRIGYQKGMVVFPFAVQRA